MLDRAAILRSLIEYQLPIEPIVAQLYQLSWDVDKDYMIITRQDIASILQRFLQQELTAEEVFYWADLLECREDVSYPADDEECLGEIILHLANPDLWGEITMAMAESMQAKLLA